jgi:hypothetical protein
LPDNGSQAKETFFEEHAAKRRRQGKNEGNNVLQDGQSRGAWSGGQKDRVFKLN